MSPQVRASDITRVVKLIDRPDEPDLERVASELAAICDSSVNTGAFLIGVCALTTEMLRGHGIIPRVIPEGAAVGWQLYHVGGEVHQVDAGDPTHAALQVVFAYANNEPDTAMSLVRGIVDSGPERAATVTSAALAAYRRLHQGAHGRVVE